MDSIWFKNKPNVTKYVKDGEVEKMVEIRLCNFGEISGDCGQNKNVSVTNRKPSKKLQFSPASGLKVRVVGGDILTLFVHLNEKIHISKENKIIS